MSETGENAGRGSGVPAWVRWTSVLCFLAPVAFLVVALTSRAIVWALSEIYAVVGAMGWLVVGVIAAMFVVDFIRARRHERGKTESQARTGRPRRLATFALLMLVAGSQLCLNVAAGRLDRHWEQRKGSGLDVYKNHDLARLVGECVRLSLLRHREGVSDDAARASLGRIAGIAPRRWNELTDERDPRVARLADAELIAFVREPGARALNVETWAELLIDFERGADARLSDEVRLAAATTVSADFGITLREALKADFTRGGEAWAAMQLDIAQSLLEREVRGADHRDPEAIDALRKASALVADVETRLPEISDLLRDVRLTQDDHARAVLDRFDRLETVMRELVGEVLAEVGEVREQTEALYQIELVKADPSLSDEEKFARILALGEPKAGSVDDEPEPIDLPPELRRFIEQMAANASLIDQHRASVLLGDFAEADRLAELYEAERRAQREAEDYHWFVSRGDRYWSDKKYDEAGGWYGRAIALRDDDPSVLNKGALSLQRARGAPAYAKNLRQAELWLTTGLDHWQAQHTSDHHDVALGLNNLAVLFEDLGRAREAEPLYREAMEMNLRLHGDADHPDVALAMNNYAGIAETLGRVDEAESIFRDTLAMRRRIYGEEADHHNVSVSLSNYAYVLGELGRTEEEERLYTQNLEMRRRIYGEDADHPEIAGALNNLASARGSLGRHAESKELFEQCLEMRRRLFGENSDHPDIATTLGNLGKAHGRLGHLNERETYQLQALEMRRRIWGQDADHHDISLSLYNLAYARRELGRPEEAEPLYRQSLEMERRLHGADADHPEIANGMGVLASVLKRLDRPEEAETLYRQALEMRRRLYGQDAAHEDISINLHNLARLLVQLGRADEAEPLYRESLAIDREIYGPDTDHREIAIGMTSLATSLRRLGRDDEAEPLYGQALDMRRRLLGPDVDNPDLAIAIINLASVRRKLGSPGDAEPLYEEALAMRRRLHAQDADHPDVIRTASELAVTQFLVGKTSDALGLLEDAAAMADRRLSEDDSLRVEVEQVLAIVKSKIEESATSSPDEQSGP